MIHEYDSPHTKEALSERIPAWRQRLRWSATGHGWYATAADGTRIFVDEATYERRLCRFFESQGMTVKTYTEIMRPAEAEWQHQCDLMRTFQANLDDWLSANEPGIIITQPF